MTVAIGTTCRHETFWKFRFLIVVALTFLKSYLRAPFGGWNVLIGRIEALEGLDAVAMANFFDIASQLQTTPLNIVMSLRECLNAERVENLETRVLDLHVAAAYVDDLRKTLNS